MNTLIDNVFVLAHAKEKIIKSTKLILIWNKTMFTALFVMSYMKFRK